MRPLPLARDTPPEVEERQIEAWRGMTSADKAETVSALTTAVLEMARAGIRDRHPGEPPRVHHMRLAAILHGRDVARRLFPDLDIEL